MTRRRRGPARALHAAILGVVTMSLTAAFAAEPVERICQGGLCIEIDQIHNPAYLHFHPANNLDLTHYNLRQGARQWEVREFEATYIPRGTDVLIQDCLRDIAGGSHCSAWQNFKLSRFTECETYALKAIEDSKAGAACGFSGLRWDTDINNHLNWCLNVDDRALPSGETTARTRGLADCTKQNNAPVFCQKYVDEAVAAAKQNETLGCGYSGARWDTDPNGHLAWCLALRGDQSAPNTETAARTTGLAACHAAKGAIAARRPGLPSDNIKKQLAPVTPGQSPSRPKHRFEERRP
jgi:hypothetical protein